MASGYSSLHDKPGNSAIITLSFDPCLSSAYNRFPKWLPSRDSYGFRTGRRRSCRICSCPKTTSGSFRQMSPTGKSSGHMPWAYLHDHHRSGLGNDISYDQILLAYSTGNRCWNMDQASSFSDMALYGMTTAPFLFCPTTTAQANRKGKENNKAGFFTALMVSYCYGGFRADPGTTPVSVRASDNMMSIGVKALRIFCISFLGVAV